MSNEFLTLVFAFLIITDLILGWINHVYFLKDSSSSDQRKALMRKFIEFWIVGAASFFPDVARLFEQNIAINPHATQIIQGEAFSMDVFNVAISTMIVTLIMIELRSIAAHFTQITGITIPEPINKLLGIDQELNYKKAKSEERIKRYTPKQEDGDTEE